MNEVAVGNCVRRDKGQLALVIAAAGCTCWWINSDEARRSQAYALEGGGRLGVLANGDRIR
jgi:hypothetical protein